jgi:uncharacterized protein YbjT (DUF2867 family)
MILGTGPTGTIGSHLLPQFVEQAGSVRGLTHSPASRSQVEGYGAEAVDGDFDQPSTLERVMGGCDHVFLLSPPSPAQPEREMRDRRREKGWVQRVRKFSCWPSEW